MTTESSYSGPASEDDTDAVVCVGEDRLTATAEQPLVFGRSDVAGAAAGDGGAMVDTRTRVGAVIGLDPHDMGISARALSVEFEQGVWWLVNLSAKRNLLLDPGYGSALIHLRPGQRHAIAVTPLGVLVPGAIFTHRLDVHVPDTALALHRPSEDGASGTIAGEDLHLTDNDRKALTAVYSPLLRAWPRRGAHPLSYQEAADLLGAPWTGTGVRKHFERVRQRLAGGGTFFDGSHAKDDLGQFLLDNAVLSAADLSLFDGGT